MPKFGQHETAQRLHLSGVGSLFALAADDKKVVKILQPPAGIWTEDQLRSEIDAFLLRCKTQRLIAKTSKHWAPVHEVSAIRAGTEGSTDGVGGEAASRAEDSQGFYIASGAYVILDRYERSLQSLLDGRVKIDNSDLRNIFTAVFQGLLDCRTLQKRPHGNIKPTNILLNNAANLSTATVHLADPAADAALNANSDKKDLADIGKILYELVNLRPFAGGTIGPSKEWHRLGPNGEDWRKLCGALLDPGAPTDERDLEKLLPKIATWTAKPKKSKAPLIAAAVLCVLIAGGITTAILLRKPPPAAWKEAKWDELCLDSHAWFEDFYGDASADKLAALSANPGYPKTAVDLITDAKRKVLAKTDYYLPVDIVTDNSGNGVRPLIALPPNEAKQPPGPDRTLVALKLVEDLQNALKPDGWNLLKQLQTHLNTYEKDRHWQEPADDIRTIIVATQPPEIPTAGDALKRFDDIKPNRNIVRALQTAIDASSEVGNIETAWAAIAANIKKIQDLQTAAHADVPILHDIGAFARALPTSGTQPAKTRELTAEAALTELHGFTGKLIPAADTLAAIATVLTKEKLDLPELTKAAEANAQPSVDNYIAFAARVPDYAVIPDPRHDWKPDVDSINEIIGVIQGTAATDPELPILKNELEKLKQTIQQTNALPLIALNGEKLHASVEAIDKTIYPALYKRGISNPNYINPTEAKADLAKNLATPPKELANASPVVLDHWKQAQKKLLDTFSPLDDATFRHQFRKEIPKRLLAAYVDLEKQLSLRVPALDIKAGPPWQSQIAARLASRFHDEALNTLVADYAKQYLPENAPDLNDPAYQSFVQSHLQTYMARCNAGRDFINGYAAIENSLNLLYLTRDETPPGTPYWPDLATQLTKAEFLPDPQVTAALNASRLSDRIATLQSLVAETDYAKVEPALAADAPELVLTAWRKLAVISLPESATYLDTEEKAQQHLAAMLQKLPNSARAQALTAELATDIPKLWNRWTFGLSKPELLEIAFQRRPKDAPLQLPGQDDRLVYNEYLFELNRDFTAHRPTPDVKQREALLKTDALAFISKTENISSDVKKLASHDKLLIALKRPLDPKNAEASNTTKAGPKLVGWESEIDNNNGVARFFYPPTGTRQFTLEFRRLPDQDSGRTVFLCTTELSLELFAHALNDPTPRAPTLNKPNWLDTTDIGQYVTWTGLRGWQVSGDVVAPNVSWLSKTTLMQKYADVPPGAKPIDTPRLDMPVQRISPWVALYTARLLGCRLPSAAEWTSAYNAFETKPGPKDWNLRGALFETQKKYVQSLHTKEPDMDWPFPDKDLFDSTKTIGARAADAPIWLPDNLVKLAPDALDRSNADTIIANSTLWFRPVPPAVGTGVPPMHDLIGNVAEFTFDGPTAAKPLTENDIQSLSTDVIEKEIDAGTLAVAGGSSLSSPLIPPNIPQHTTAASMPIGRCDLGMRLAFTSPNETMESVLLHHFSTPWLIPAPPAPAHNAASLLQPQ